MDGRWKRLLVGGVFCALVGCSHFGDRNPNPPTETREPPLGTMSQKPAEEKRGPVSASTQVTLGDLKLQASLAEGRSPAERDDLQNQARVAYEQALKRDSKSFEAMIAMARLYATMHDKNKCVEWYQKAAKANPGRGEIPNEMGFTMLKQFKDPERAITCFHEATKVEPENRAFRKSLGFTLAKMGRYEEAYAWLSRAMPSEADAHYNLAGIMEHNGNRDLAKQEFAKAMQSDPNHTGARQAMAYYSGSSSRPSDVPVQPANYERIEPNIVDAPDVQPIPSVKKKPSRPNASVPMLDPTSGWDR
jgi:Tfp pilus assembly protein PilF